MDRLDISATQDLFGPPAGLYGPVVAATIARVAPVQYRFWSNESIQEAAEAGRIGLIELNAVTVTEVLLSAHLAATTSIIRSARWFEATWREHEAGNLLGWAACCRSLLEAIGDTIDGLLSAGLTLAETMPSLMKGLSGFDEGLFNLEEIEDKLIHFSHGRKVGRTERATVPGTHVARQTAEYIALLETAGGPAKLYAELCQIGHPARGSLSWMYVNVEGGFRVEADRDASAIAEIVARHRDELHLLPSLAFNPGLFVLRVLVKFGLFPRIPELRDFSFQGAKGWAKIKAVLDKAPPTPRRHPLVDGIVRSTSEPPDGVPVAR